MSDVCGDNRFEIIAEAKSDLLEATNIKGSPEEMAVLDSFLFRCWQMGWLKKYELNEFEWCTDCKEYDQEKHCCHRWTKVIRQTVEDIKNRWKWIPVTEALPEDNRQVLVYAQSTHFALAKYDEMRESDGEYKKQWVTFDAWKPFYTIKNVIAWMPLPEAYRGE